MKKKGTFVLAAAILISSMISCGVKKNDRPDEEISSNGMVLDSVEIYDSITANGSRPKGTGLRFWMRMSI